MPETVKQTDRQANGRIVKVHYLCAKINKAITAQFMHNDNNNFTPLTTTTTVLITD